MCRKGNDLVRGLLWNCAKCAAGTNPAIQALYARLRTRGVPGDVAFGYCMTKLLHLAYAVWKTNRPFDPKHRRWDITAANVDWQAEPTHPTGISTDTASSSSTEAPSTPAQKNAAGLKEHCSGDNEVTAASSNIDKADAVHHPAPAAADNEDDRWIDFAHLRSQVTIEQVLKHLGVFHRLRCTPGSRSQYRGPCPIHAADGKRHRSFSVNLGKQAFRCFHPECGAQGNVLDLWAALRGLPLRQAGLDLMDTFDLSPTPKPEHREEEPVKESVPKPRKRATTREPKTTRKKSKK
jgi:hypothetical protein